MQLEGINFQFVLTTARGKSIHAHSELPENICGSTAKEDTGNYQNKQREKDPSIKSLV